MNDATHRNIETNQGRAITIIKDLVKILTHMSNRAGKKIAK